MRGTIAAVAAVLLLSACPTESGKPTAADIEISPDTLQACCDPDGEFPQRVGFVYVTNNSKYSLEIRPTSDGSSAPSYAGPGETAVVAATVDSCGDQLIGFELQTDPVSGWEVSFDDACARRSEDDDDDLSQPSLDLLFCDAAHDAGGNPWVHCWTDGTWPPSDQLYSWFISVVIANGSTVLSDCTVQRHDGVNSTFCDLGEVGNLMTWTTEQGLVMWFPANRATDYAVDTGYLETASSTFYSDMLSGSFDAPEAGSVEPPPQ